MTEIRVTAAAGAYPVIVEAGVSRDAGRRIRDVAPEVRRWAVISDDRVAPLHGAPVTESLRDAGCHADLHTFPAGEVHKTRDEWAGLTDRLLDSGLGRDGGVVAVGGGVTGDLAGFVAATYMRGVSVVQVPTSVVAMVDSAVGGKTGVDTPAGKNLVGAFHAPRLVLVDPLTIATLPRAERAQGWAEALKHGAITDLAYFERLERDAPALLEGEPGAVAGAVARSIEIKAEVVGADEREAGRREILNYGHTLGHALEAASDYRLPHGSAVGLGMLLEARLGESLGITDPEVRPRLLEALERFELPTRDPGAGLEHAALGSLLIRDKKVRDGQVRVVLLSTLGAVARATDGGAGWAHPVAAERLEALHPLT